jgi:VanZ family protein
VILIVSVLPNDELPSLSMWESDKVMHFAVYCILTILTTYTIIGRNSNYSLRKSVYSAIGLCILYGMIIECIQYLLPTRQFDLLDELANSIGCFLGAAIVLLISGRQKRSA